jgi:hypothetical protein
MLSSLKAIFNESPMTKLNTDQMIRVFTHLSQKANGVKTKHKLELI